MSNYMFFVINLPFYETFLISYFRNDISLVITNFLQFLMLFSLYLFSVPFLDFLLAISNALLAKLPLLMCTNLAYGQIAVNT